ncbi:LacI family DNA-binding transcriptional regulator [Promicromonospora sukumoe]|uniref:LacI family DNA-binding transcriptional regulator n=1 Tax=Promicromonospora sukumoe TaxID=88382 RepID=UPI0037C73D61
MNERRRAGRPTLADVARAADVSLSTASRVFSGLPTVDPELVTRVLQTGSRLGYQPSVAAQMTANGRSALVGVVSDHPREPHFAAIFQGIVSLAGGHGLTVMTSGAEPGGDSVRLAVRSLIGYRPQAIVVVSRRTVDAGLAADPIVERYGRTASRIVSIGSGLAGTWIPSVAAQDAAGAERLAGALVHQGYERAVVVGVGADFPAESLRALTLTSRLREGIAHVAGVRALVPSRDEGYRVTRDEILGAAVPPDVIVTVADELAVGVTAALRDASGGGRSPIAVTGFGDIALAGDLVPALTTVRTHLAELGKKAVRLALDPQDASAVPDADVVVRQSTPLQRRHDAGAGHAGTVPA